MFGNKPAYVIHRKYVQEIISVKRTPILRIFIFFRTEISEA